MSKLTGKKLEQLRRKVEATATFGLLLVAVALVVPFTNLTNMAVMSGFRWVYAAGALIYTIARVVDVNDPADSPRLRRLRRMEAWAGFALIIGAAFWFYNAERYGTNSTYTLTVMRDTITFTLVGGVLQIISAWLINSRANKEAKEQASSSEKGKR